MTCYSKYLVIAHHGKGVAEIDETSVETNLVFAKLVNVNPAAFVKRLEEVRFKLILPFLCFKVYIYTYFSRFQKQKVTKYLSGSSLWARISSVFHFISTSANRMLMKFAKS